MENIEQKLANELGVKISQVIATIKLIDDGNTIPFIARYRKEVTGNLSDEILRKLSDRLEYLRNLEKRKEEVIRLIDEGGNLTIDIKNKIVLDKNTVNNKTKSGLRYYIFVIHLRIHLVLLLNSKLISVIFY